jgi:hypothetical protein
VFSSTARSVVQHDPQCGQGVVGAGGTGDRRHRGERRGDKPRREDLARRTRSTCTSPRLLLVWINQVERWASFLATQMPQRSAHASVRALERDIRDWTETWNAAPKPFVWVKAAKEILKLTRPIFSTNLPVQDTSPSPRTRPGLSEAMVY